ADDEQAIRSILRMVLQMAGHNVETAANGEEVLTLARARAFDLIITDIIMPKKEGIETILELKKLHPAIKVIAISGGGRKGSMDFLEVAEKVGASATIAKPFEPDDLVAAVKKCLKE
ncbi:MAG TPA: response regulator, partial [Sphingomonadales bacterium]|nr:response regulator [Sphingomonadales bacterium]